MTTSKLFLLAGILFAVACSEPQPDVVSESPTSPRPNEMHINMIRGNPNALDPVLISSKLSDDIALQIYDRLLTLDTLLVLQPELARSWEVSEDGRTYTFHLRTDVFFHDNPCFEGGVGRKVTAEDVRYSFERNCDPQQKTVQFWAFKDKVLGASEYFESRLSNDGTVTSVEGLQAPNDSTFVITLTAPYAPFIYYVVNSLGCVVPKEAVAKYGDDFFANPVGSGPFVFKEWLPDRYISLEKNSKYWQKDGQGRQLPLLDKVRISFITDDKVQLQQFESGELDECYGLPMETFDNIVADGSALQPQYDKYILQQSPAMLTWFVNFLTTEAPFDDARIRQAFSLAIDRERIVTFALKNSPLSAAYHGVTPPVMPGYNVGEIEGLMYRPELARSLLAEAGFPGGAGFPPVVFSVYEEPRLVLVAEIMQAMLQEELGIQVEIRKLQFARLLDEAKMGRLQMWGTRWYGDYPEAENYLNLYNGLLVPSNEQQPSYPNGTRYSNDTVNSLLLDAVRENELSERNRLYVQAEQIIVRDAPSVFLTYEKHYRLLQPWIGGYPLDPMNRVILKYAYTKNTK